MALISALLSAAGIRPLEVGMCYAFGAFGSVAGARIGKWLLVRHQDALSFSLAVTVCACGSFLFALVESPALLTTAQIVTCVGFGVIASSRGSILNALLPSGPRAVCLSIFSSMEGVLTGLMGTTLGYLYENYHRSLVPSIITIVCLLLAPCAHRALTRIAVVAGD